MRLPARPVRRRGVAAVELAFVTLLFIVPVILGIWEVGRLVHVQQIVANGAREGARVAGQGFVLRANTDGSVSQVQIKKEGSNPSVKQAVVDYLRSAGLTNLTTDDVTVEFDFTSARTTNYSPIRGLDLPGTVWDAGSFPTDPCYGDKGQTFTVHVSVPWSKVRWLNLGILHPEKVEFTVNWRMLIDDSFSVNTTLPTW